MSVCVCVKEKESESPWRVRFSHRPSIPSQSVTSLGSRFQMPLREGRNGSIRGLISSLMGLERIGRVDLLSNDTS